jgi:hypothetical protein
MMQRTLALGLLAVGWLMLGCDARGVSLGTEELCVLDDQLAVAESNSPDEHVSTCARIGDNLLLNAGFEAPLISTCPTVESGPYCEFPAADIAGWQTSGLDQVIEIWQDGFRGVPAAEGGQFGELDATSPDTLWQDVELRRGQLMYWSFQHHGRNGIEKLELLIGPPDAPASIGVFSSGVDAWQTQTGLYRVPDDAGRVTRFALASRTGLAEGNLVDAIVFAPVN